MPALCPTLSEHLVIQSYPLNKGTAYGRKITYTQRFPDTPYNPEAFTSAEAVITGQDPAATTGK